MDMMSRPVTCKTWWHVGAAVVYFPKAC